MYARSSQNDQMRHWAEIQAWAFIQPVDHGTEGGQSEVTTHEKTGQASAEVLPAHRAPAPLSTAPAMEFLSVASLWTFLENGPCL